MTLPLTGHVLNKVVLLKPHLPNKKNNKGECTGKGDSFHNFRCRLVSMHFCASSIRCRMQLGIRQMHYRTPLGGCTFKNKTCDFSPALPALGVTGERPVEIMVHVVRLLGCQSQVIVRLHDRIFPVEHTQFHMDFPSLSVQATDFVSISQSDSCFNKSCGALTFADLVIRARHCRSRDGRRDGRRG